jgi:hypothetical protein
MFSARLQPDFADDTKALREGEGERELTCIRVTLLGYLSSIIVLVFVFVFVIVIVIIIIIIIILIIIIIIFFCYYSLPRIPPRVSTKTTNASRVQS